MANTVLGTAELMTAADLRALVFSEDPFLITTFSEVLRTFGVQARKNDDSNGPPTTLENTKFEALVVDFDTILATLPILAATRQSPSNKHALVFAVATGTANRKQALQQGANFVFERPLAVSEISQVIRRSYNLMVRDRRRYFRCDAEFPVVIRCDSGAEIHGTAFNISSTGIAVRTASAFNVGQEVQLALSLSGPGTRLAAGGKVMWDDRHGKTGFQLKFTTTDMQQQVDSWLDNRFAEMLAKSVLGNVSESPVV
jgi:Tfp pilus assembly protein PilZ